MDFKLFRLLAGSTVVVMKSGWLWLVLYANPFLPFIFIFYHIDYH